MINRLSPPSRFIIAATAAAILSTWITPFQRDLFVGDETKYGQVVREMRATGAVFLPTLNGAPFTHKPPLHFWVVNMLTIPLGVYSTWAFVLPSLLAFLFLLCLMWKMGGPMAAFVCATSLMMWGSAQTARMDVSFTAFIVLGAWMLQRERLLAAGVAFGVATLIKGPMAPVIGVVLFLLEWWRLRRSPRGVVPAIAAMAVIPLLWFVPAMLMGGSTYTHEVIVKQTIGCATSTWVHHAPPWFYILHLPGILFPWFFVAVAALRGANRFYINWILAVLIPYSLMSSKLDVYMMAMIPPAALLIADSVEDSRPRLSGQRRAAVLHGPQRKGNQRDGRDQVVKRSRRNRQAAHRVHRRGECRRMRRCACHPAKRAHRKPRQSEMDQEVQIERDVRRQNEVEEVVRIKRERVRVAGEWLSAVVVEVPPRNLSRPKDL